MLITTNIPLPCSLFFIRNSPRSSFLPAESLKSPHFQNFLSSLSPVRCYLLPPAWVTGSAGALMEPVPSIGSGMYLQFPKKQWIVSSYKSRFTALQYPILKILKIFLKADSSFKNLFCRFFPHISVMPYFLSGSGNICFTARIPENKAIFIAVFLQP